MAIRIVRFGIPKKPGEGVRLGTVRRPPRGVKTNRYAAEHYFDVWLPNLAPSAELISKFRDSASATSWNRFAARYQSEMSKPDASRLLDALAALSHHSNFSVGCYCEDETRCHRSLLRDLLKQRGAELAE
jgi:uncharacterized protein YeaO (DUF488 family)